MVTKKQKKIIKDIKKTSKELKEKGLTTREIILIVTSILILAGALVVYALLGIHIDDLLKQINTRTNDIKRLRTSLGNIDKKWRTQFNQNQRLLQENENFKKSLNNIEQENQVLEAEVKKLKNFKKSLNKIEQENLALKEEVKKLKNTHELYRAKLVETEKGFTEKASSLTLTKNERNKLEKDKKFLEKEINVLMAKNIKLETKIKNFRVLQNEYLLGYMDTQHENTRLKKKYKNSNKRTKKSIKHLQKIADKRKLANRKLQNELKKRPWKPSGGREYPYTQKKLNYKTL